MKLRHRSLWSWAVLLSLACAAFVRWPLLDLWIATRFYAQDGVFPAGQWWAVQAVYVWAPPLGWVLTGVMLGVMCWRWWRPEQIRVAVWRQALAWVLVAVVGIGLVVHEGLKNQVGRPRPHQTVDMGGAALYVPALQVSASCDRNCSFVSGHAALGFCLLSFGMWSTPARKRRWMGIGLLAGSVIGGVRIVQGGHFFSDVLFSFLAMWGSALLVREVWLRLLALRALRHRQKRRLATRPS
jgi:lipid A 4'-phosphatase